MRVDDYLLAQRDSVAEAELARRLRELAPQQAYELIAEYIDKQPGIGLLLASRVLRDPGQFEQILCKAFRRANASTIRNWLEACVSRIGPRRAMTIFEALVEESPVQAAKTVYWTRIVLGNADPGLRPRLEALYAQLEPLLRR